MSRLAGAEKREAILTALGFKRVAEFTPAETGLESSRTFDHSAGLRVIVHDLARADVYAVEGGGPISLIYPKVSETAFHLMMESLLEMPQP